MRYQHFVDNNQIDGDNKHMIKKYFLLTLGSFISAFALYEFLIPNSLVCGGVTGLSTLAYLIWKFPIWLMVLILNFPIFILGLFHEGKKFIVRSLYSTILLSVFLKLLSLFPTREYDLILSAFYGGGLVGLGIAMTLLAGGTTGGIDIISKICNRKWPHISIGTFILGIDVIVITLLVITQRNLEIALYSAMALIASTFIVDLITQGAKTAKIAFVISDKHLAISDAIHKRLHRGATLMYGEGTYSETEKNVLLCSVKPFELPTLKKIVLEFDKHAFIITSDAREVIGMQNMRKLKSGNKAIS